ncbi:DNA-binding GntR family transcriptional regulator [Arthrobacter sp. SLBN-100]|nr:DNA-binding GntR family transcriptional regulator [Arthrobacter sp. SLBN-100]
MYTNPPIYSAPLRFWVHFVYTALMRASERAYKTLREDIVEWRLLPGTVLAEVEQSERLGLSRTPLREALGRLSAEGLTQTAPGRGVVVSDISLEDVDELFELREILECRAAALAAQRGEVSVFAALYTELSDAPFLLGAADPARHSYYALVGRLDEAIDAAIANSYLAQAMRSLRVHLVRVRRLAANDDGRLTAAAAEHAAIAEAIAEGNPRLAEAATTVHLHRSLSHIKATHQPH